MSKITVTTITKRKARRQNSFWYDGQVAIVSDGKREISIEATGHVDITFKENEDSFENGDARKEAKKRKLTDRALKNAYFSNENWFELFEVTGENVDGDMVKSTGYIESTYDDAIAMAKGILLNK